MDLLCRIIDADRIRQSSTQDHIYAAGQRQGVYRQCVDVREIVHALGNVGRGIVEPPENLKAAAQGVVDSNARRVERRAVREGSGEWSNIHARGHAGIRGYRIRIEKW